MVKYHMPTKVFFGEDSLIINFEEVKQLGNKAFIVTGKSSAKKSGVLDDLEKLLNENNIEYCIFDRVMENPELETIHIAKNELQIFNPDFIIGIGGGSPIDAAKAISVCAANNFESTEFYNGEKIKKAIPIVAITTTSGTGTEVTPFSVVTDVKAKKKAGFGNPLIFPIISFLDPKYTISLPFKTTKDTAIDALSHLLEGIYSNKKNEIVNPLIFQGIKLIIENLETALEDPTNIEARKNLMLAAMYGGMVIAQTSTTLQHSIGYPLTTEYGISHGNANGMVMEAIMELFYSKRQNILDQLFDYLQLTKNEFYNWLNKIGVQDKIDLDEKFIESNSKQVMQSRNMALNPFEVDIEIIENIYRGLQKK